MRIPRVGLTTILAATLLLAAGCLGVSINEGSITVTLTMSEGKLDRMLEGPQRGEGDFLLKEITNIDLIEPDTIHVEGVYDAPGGGEAEGSVEMRFGAADGVLEVQITDVDIEGLNMDSPEVQEMNADLARELRQGFGGEHDAEVLAAGVADGRLYMVIRASLR